jgi:hypothetical protein
MPYNGVTALSATGRTFDLRRASLAGGADRRDVISFHKHGPNGFNVGEPIQNRATTGKHEVIVGLFTFAGALQDPASDESTRRVRVCRDVPTDFVKSGPHCRNSLTVKLLHARSPLVAFVTKARRNFSPMDDIEKHFSGSELWPTLLATAGCSTQLCRQQRH